MCENCRGCKFSAEEERVVIELQAQFGNKWAKIATYLEGRTDNDVKNFWSSRRKRLERMLQKPSPSSSSSSSSAKPHNKNKATISHMIHHPPPPIVDEEVPASCSSNHHVEQNPAGNEKFQMVDESEEMKNVKEVEEATPLHMVPSFESCASEYTFSQVLLPDGSRQVDYGGLPPPTEPFDASFLEVLEQHRKPGLAMGMGRIAQSSSLPANGFFEDFPSDIFDYFDDLPNPLHK